MGFVVNLAAAIKEPVVAFADIVTAFSDKAIGTKVVGSKDEFLSFVVRGIEQHDPNSDRVPGQHFVKLDDAAVKLVSGGVGKRTLNADDYVIREHRGQMSMYLKRGLEAPAETVHCVVYTKEAYLKDPDGTQAEFDRIEQATPGYTHVLVAVLASSGSKPALSPYRFVHNLAGGNNEALAWSADEIREKAKEILAYENNWITVAD